MTALLWLIARSARNRLAGQLRQLRRPRYLVALAAAAIYLALVLGQGSPRSVLGRRPDWVEALGATILLLTIVWGWIVGGRRHALAYDPAEVHLLFPAPVTRAALVRYKLVRVQLVIIANVVVWTTLFAREQLGVSAPLRAVALWLVLSVIQLHRVGAALVRTNLSEHGRAGWRRDRLAGAVAVGVVATMVLATAIALPALHRAAQVGMDALAQELIAVSRGPVQTVLLFPFRLLVRPLTATTTAEWLAAVWPPALLLAAHYLWVVRSDVAFEEAALEASLERAHRQAVRRRAQGAVLATGGDSRPLVALRPTGHPAVAILWKNVSSVLRRRRFLRLAGVVVVLGGALGAASLAFPGGLMDPIGTFLGVWAGFSLLFGPQWVRNDLRSDLLKLDLLHTYPLSGRQIVAAEVGAATIVLTLVHWSLFMLAYLALIGSSESLMSPGLRALTLGAAIVTIPAINWTSLLIYNAAAVALPAWVHLGERRPGRMEALGQTLLVTIAFAVVLAAALAPPTALAAAVQALFVGPLGVAGAAVVAVVAGVSMVWLQGWWAAAWIGRMLERTEPLRNVADGG